MRSSSNGELCLPPGFRFHPSDEELVKHYLCRKCAAMPIPVPTLIADIDLYKYDPWQLPGMARYGEKEWYFFSPRDRKYPNGTRPNRAAASGYWKATGADKPIGGPKAVAIKKALVFYTGKAPKGDKTNWIMHEYRLAATDRSARKHNNLRLDDWVLCRIYNKKGSSTDKSGKMIGSKNDDKAVTMDTSDSMPRVHADSSCSEHVISPEFTCDREVQSQHRWSYWDRSLDVPFNYGSTPAGGFSDLGAGLMLEPGSRDPIQDILTFLQKPY